MNIDLINQIYEDVKRYIQFKTIYSPRITQKSLKQSDKFPLITIIEDDNRNEIVSTDFIESTDKIFLTINIYAEDMALENKTISNVTIARELMKLVDDVIGKKYQMNRVSCKPTPNLDNMIYRITMKYTKKIITNKNILI